MKVSDIQINGEYLTKVGNDLVRVKVKFERTTARGRRAYQVARVDTGAYLPKLRAPAALRAVG